MERTSNSDPYQVDAEVIADLAARAALPNHLGGVMVPFAVIEDGQKVHAFTDLLENPLEAPTRIRACTDFLSAESFVEYVKDFRTPTTRLFANERQYEVTAYLDYHGADQPSRVTHTAKLRLVQSPEWKTWTGKNKQSMPQVAFAEFLEDNLLDIRQPDSATIIEAVTFLEAKKDATFLSGTDLRSGAIQFKYSEEIETKGRGDGKIPDGFVLRIQPFERAEPVSIPAKLRFRIDDGKLSFHYVLQQPENLLDAAFGNVMEKVEADLGLTALFGTVSPNLKY